MSTRTVASSRGTCRPSKKAQVVDAISMSPADAELVGLIARCNYIRARFGFPPLAGEMSEGQRGRTSRGKWRSQRGRADGALPTTPLDGRSIPQTPGFRRKDNDFWMVSQVLKWRRQRGYSNSVMATG